MWADEGAPEIEFSLSVFLHVCFEKKCSLAYVLQLDGDLLQLVGQLGLGLLQRGVAHAQLFAGVFQLCDADGQATPVKVKMLRVNTMFQR